MRSGLIAIVLIGLLGTSLVAAPALGAPSGAITDCNAHGRLTAQYTDAQLRTALSTMPADVKEYTDCYDVIQQQLLSQLGSSHDGGGSIAPSSGSFLPTPVIVVLVLLALVAASFGAVAVRRHRSG